jgi:hypothetical protein
MPHSGTPALAVERRLAHRRLLAWVHATQALLITFLYLSQVNFGGFVYTTRGAGVSVIILAAPALLPYVISGIFSRRVVTDDRVRLVIFIFVLTAGTVFIGFLLLGTFGTFSRLGLLGVFVLQTLGYVGIANVLWSVQRDTGVTRSAERPPPNDRRRGP